MVWNGLNYTVSLPHTNGWWSAFGLHIRVIKDIHFHFCPCSEKTPWTRAKRWWWCILTMILMLGTFMLTFYISNPQVSWPLKFWTRLRSSQSYDDDSVSIFSQLSKWLRQRKTHTQHMLFCWAHNRFLFDDSSVVSHFMEFSQNCINVFESRNIL